MLAESNRSDTDEQPIIARIGGIVKLGGDEVTVQPSIADDARTGAARAAAYGALAPRHHDGARVTPASS